MLKETSIQSGIFGLHDRIREMKRDIFWVESAFDSYKESAFSQPENIGGDFLEDEPMPLFESFLPQTWAPKLS